MLDNIPLEINLYTFVQTVDEPGKPNIGSPIKVPPELRITTLLSVLQSPMYCFTNVGVTSFSGSFFCGISRSDSA